MENPQQGYAQPNQPLQPEIPMQRGFQALGVQPGYQQMHGNPQQHYIHGMPIQPDYARQVKPVQNAQEITTAAQAIRHAMKGIGTDEKTIIHIAKTHSAQQRAAIAESFCAQFGMTLESEFKKELSGKLESALVAFFQDRPTFWAQQIHNAIHRIGTDEKRLIQLVLMLSDQDALLVSDCYRSMFNQEMFTAIQNDISDSDWGRLLKAWIKGQNVVDVDPQQAAEQLHMAARGAGTDEDVFIRILATSSPQSYHQIAQVYQQKYGKPLRDIIKREFSSRSEFAFLLAHDYLMDPVSACAFLLHRAVSGTGTDDESLVNITALFSDYFKGETIRRAYTPYGDVTKALKHDLSGKYETAILSMWGLE